MHARLLNASSGSSKFPKVGSELYRCFLKHLVEPKSPVSSLEKAASRTETAVAEGIIVKAFSDELTKLGFGEQFLWPLMRTAGGEFLWQLGREGVNRMTGTGQRSMGDIVKDTGVNTVFHHGLNAAGAGIDKLPQGMIQSGLKTLHGLAQWNDPVSYSTKGRLVQEGLETGAGMLAKGLAKPGLSKPQPLTNASTPPGQTSYDQLRRTDPRVVSTQYFS